MKNNIVKLTVRFVRYLWIGILKTIHDPVLEYFLRLRPHFSQQVRFSIFSYNQYNLMEPNLHSTPNPSSLNPKKQSRFVSHSPSPPQKSPNPHLTYRFISNDDTRTNLLKLINLKSLLAKQLPKMPKNYITRLVFDRYHECLIAEDDIQQSVVGGLCFRVFSKQSFVELAFLAVNNKIQTNGIGSKLLNFLKEQMQRREIQYILTYADNTAVGFFKKQGFCKEFHSQRQAWEGFLKKYEGGLKMQCRINQKVDYHSIKSTVSKQKKSVIETINALPWTCQSFSTQQLLPLMQEYIYTDLDGNSQKLLINPMKIPGIMESGWTWQQYESSKKSLTLKEMGESSEIIGKIKKYSSYKLLTEIIAASRSNLDDSSGVNAVDLKQIEINLVSNKYEKIQDFLEDVQRMFNSARTYCEINSKPYKLINDLWDSVMPMDKGPNQTKRSTRKGNLKQK